MFDLSIFIPTHYSGPRHYSLIMRACELARTDKNIEVVVSDNSDNPEKFAFLTGFASENFRVIKGPPQKNHLFALEQTTGRYVLILGDDDTLLPASLPGIIRDLNGEGGFIGAIGHCGRELDTGYDFHHLHGMDDMSFGNRVGAITRTLGIGNMAYHAIVDRSVLLKSFRLWLSIPNPMSHHDQLATLFVVCSGRLKQMVQPYFIYNMANHVRSQRVNTEVRHAKYFGHPVSICILSRLILAVEGAFLIGSPDFSVPEDQKSVAINTWFRSWHAAWQHSIRDSYYVGPEFTSCPDAAHVLALAQKYANAPKIDARTLLAEIAGMYESINGSGENYHRFWTRLTSDGAAAVTVS